jgi:DHA1 family multidrug resistance protein-like MFS transporter
MSHVTKRDIVDEELERAEEDASPRQFPSRAPQTLHDPVLEHKTETGEPIEPVLSHGSSSSDDSSHAMERAPTQRDVLPGLEKNETVMSRIQTARSQHSGTVGSTVRSRVSKKPIPTMGAGKPYPTPLPDREEYVVEFDGADDPLHGQNWPMKKKLYTSAILAYTTFVAVFGSSIFSAGIPFVAAHFHVSREVVTLGTSLYVLGFAFGPILWAPLSELRGRRLPILIASFGLMVFNFAVASAKDLQTVMLCRFFAGFFGSAPLSVVAAVFSDIFNNQTRGLAVTVFSLCVFTGPLMAPFVGGFISINPHLGWRWTEYIVGILVSGHISITVVPLTFTGFCSFCAGRIVHGRDLSSHPLRCVAPFNQRDIWLKEFSICSDQSF